MKAGACWWQKKKKICLLLRLGLPEQAMGCLPFIGLGLIAEGKPVSTEFSCSIHVYNNNYYVHSLVC